MFEQIRNRVASQEVGRGEEEKRREFEALLAEKRAKEEELKRARVRDDRSDQDYDGHDG